MTNKYSLKLIRACLFSLNRESNTTDVKFIRHVNLEKPKDEYRHLIDIFEENIARKVRGNETKYFGTKGNMKSAIEVIRDKTYKGKKPTAYCGTITDENSKKDYQKMLNCNGEDEFRLVASRIADRYASELRFPKGIICFLQFTFQLSRKDEQRFISILNADYKTDIVRYNETEILNYLSEVFEDDFKSTVIYPYIVEEKVENEGKGEIKNKSPYLHIDRTQLKIHVKPQHDPSIYLAVGTNTPIDAQAKIINNYEQKRSEIKSLDQLEKTAPEEFKLADLDIKFGDCLKFKVNAKEFSEKVKIIHTKYGDGLVVKNQEIKILLGKHDLFLEGKLKKVDLGELNQDDK